MCVNSKVIVICAIYLINVVKEFKNKSFIFQTDCLFIIFRVSITHNIKLSIRFTPSNVLLNKAISSQDLIYICIIFVAYYNNLEPGDYKHSTFHYFSLDSHPPRNSK